MAALDAGARGRTGGRKLKLSPTQARDAQTKYDFRDWTVQQIAELYSVPRSTVYGYLTRNNEAERHNLVRLLLRPRIQDT